MKFFVLENVVSLLLKYLADFNAIMFMYERLLTQPAVFGNRSRFLRYITSFRSTPDRLLLPRRGKKQCSFSILCAFNSSLSPLSVCFLSKLSIEIYPESSFLRKLSEFF